MIEAFVLVGALVPLAAMILVLFAAARLRTPVAQRAPQAKRQ